MNTPWKPAAGGHAPGYARDAFIAAIEAFESWEDGEPEPAVELNGQDIKIGQVCGALWNCRDFLPGVWVDTMDQWNGPCDPQVRHWTYARAARRLKDLIVLARAA